MFNLRHVNWVCFVLLSGLNWLIHAVSPNISTIIVHRQYYEDHIVFIHFKNVRYEKEPVRTVAEYRCTSGYDIDLYCVASWQPIPHCQKNNTESDVFYNCIISNKKVLLSYRYEIKAAVKSSMGWRNHTTSFRVELPSVSEPLEDLSAYAIDHDTVRLSWRRVELMRDLQSFKPENIDLILKVVRTYANVSSSKEFTMKPTSVSADLHGFESSRNYSLVASYHFVISKLMFPWSDTTGPVTVWIPEKVHVSEAATNQSCEKFSNGTNTFLNITWMAPLSKRNVGKLLMAKLEIEYSGVRLFHETWQRPGTQGSLILDERSRSDVSVKIMICNKAGCSSLITYKCDFYKSTGNNPLDTFHWQSEVGLSIGVFVVSGIILGFCCYYQKRKPPRHTNTNESNLPVFGPRPENSYDEPCLVVAHSYHQFTIESTIDDMAAATVATKEGLTY